MKTFKNHEIWKKIDRIRNKPSLNDTRDTTEPNKALEYRTFKVLFKRQSKMFVLGVFQPKNNVEKNFLVISWSSLFFYNWCSDFLSEKTHP